MAEITNRPGRYTPPARPEKIFDAALRDLRHTMKKGETAAIEPSAIGVLASSLVAALFEHPADRAPEPATQQALSQRYVSLLALTVPSRRLRQGMAETLPVMATHLSCLTEDDSGMLANHRILVQMLRLAAPTDIAKAIPLGALVEARGNIGWYANIMPDPWVALATDFDRATGGNTAWKTRLSHTSCRRNEPDTVRHAKIPDARNEMPLSPAIGDRPSVYFKGHLGDVRDVEDRLGRCMADPQDGLRQAVQLAVVVAPHAALKPGLARHNPDLARRLIRAVRRDATNSDLLALYAEAVGAPVFAAAGVPPRKMKAVLAAMPEEAAARFARSLGGGKVPAPVKRTVIEADAQDAAKRALKTLRDNRPAEGYRQVMDQFAAIADPRTRREGLRPVLPKLLPLIFRDARRDPRALLQLDRLIPMAGSGLRDVGLTAEQSALYADFARRTGRMESLAMLDDRLSAKRGASLPLPALKKAFPLPSQPAVDRLRLRA